MEDWLERLEAALDAEEAWQRDEHRRLTELPLEARILAGVSWPLLTLVEAEAAGRGRFDLVLQAPRRAVLHAGIGPGDPVRVRVGGREHTGRCRGVDLRTAEIRVDRWEDAAGPVEVSLRFDATTFRRHRESLRRARENPGPLGEVLLGLRAPGEPEPLTKVPAPLEALEASQRAAALAALAAPDVALIHGPPGTGKTWVLARLLQALVEAGERPWALADANAAVDHLALAAAGRGLDVVRLGAPGRVGAAALALTLEERVRRGPLAPVLGRLAKDLARLAADPSRQARQERRMLWEERDALREQAEAAVLQSAQVVACTLGSLPRWVGRLDPAHTAVVDEATQATEPAVWTAAVVVRRLILVGDPHQLGPVVTRPAELAADGRRTDSRAALLERSLMERLLALPPEKAPPMPMLEVQRRMGWEIHALVDEVYGPSYVPDPSVAEHRLTDLPGVVSTPITERAVGWIDTSGAGLDEARDPTSGSLANAGEVALVGALVQHLRDAGVAAEDIGVIAPYSAQVAALGDHPALEGVEVATVNAFQGREKEVIVLSTTRSNLDGELGFVADRRRLTVALTRARRALWIVGDAATVASWPDLERLAEEVPRESAWSEPWIDAWGG